MMEIEGQDSSGARGRLSDNFDLFRSMLMHLFRQFSDVTIPAHSDDLAVHAGRMHKLKGSADILEAKTIHQLAAEPEAAGVADEREAAWHLAPRSAALSQRLRECAALAVLAARAETEHAA